ncbi:glutamine amidotransferase [Gordonia sp. CPCC 205515]|uniref:glutamine amidotransferase n=1 Tax=Gordonia sp. CPCC 205515 TaxID=3140791 RepID=UPI003AF347DD
MTVSKPFLLLSIRADDDAADEEYAAFARFAGLAESELIRVRTEQAPIGDVVVDDYAGIIVGGGPFNASDPDHLKHPIQRRVETELAALLDRIVAADTWFLGACYGIGLLGTHQGAVVDRTFSEPISAVPVTLSDAGQADPLFGVLPPTFDAFVGHKEAISELSPGAVALASSPACPVQAFRVGSRVYATQFHPELDVDGLCTRITTYQHHGYYDPAEHDALQAMARRSVVTHPPELLRRFVELARGQR